MSPPDAVTLRLRPSSRYDVIDVNRIIEEEHGDVAQGHRRAMYCSFHTTAGFLEPSVVSRLKHRREHLDQYIGAFQTLFPPDADYRHDQLELREELSSEQREVEPRNADSHLAAMGAGVRNCVMAPSRLDLPVYFVDLDGVNGPMRRERTATALFFDSEHHISTTTVKVPVSKHPIDSVNLADARLGLIEQVEEAIAACGLQNGRVEIALAPGENQAALTVNEYETLLMQHDLPEVLRNPFKFAAEKSYNMLRDPLSVPGKAKNYAKYDFVQIFNKLMETLGVNDSVIERLLARMLSFPADRFFRMKRNISFQASFDPEKGRPTLLRGVYQSPILVQWGASEDQSRELQLRLYRFE